jgi:hypothetical protein
VWPLLLSTSETPLSAGEGGNDPARADVVHRRDDDDDGQQQQKHTKSKKEKKKKQPSVNVVVQPKV